MLSSCLPALALRLVSVLALLAVPVASLSQCIQLSTPSYRPTYDNSVPDDAGLWNITGFEYVEVAEKRASLSVNLTLKVAGLDITCAGEAEGASYLSQWTNVWNTERLDERVISCSAKGRPDFTGTLTPVWVLSNLNLTLQANWACDGTQYYDPDAEYPGNQTAQVLATLPFQCSKTDASYSGQHCPTLPRTPPSQLRLSTSIGFEPLLRRPTRSCAARSFLHPELELWNLTALTPKKKLARHDTSTLSALSVVLGNRADDGLWRCDLSGMDDIPPATDAMLAEVRTLGAGPWWYRCHVFSRGPSRGVETWVSFDAARKEVGIDHRWECDDEKQTFSFHSIAKKKLEIDCVQTEGSDQVACGPSKQQVVIPATIDTPTGTKVPEKFRNKHDESYTLDRSMPGCLERSQNVTWTVANARPGSGCTTADAACDAALLFDLRNEALNYTTSCKLGRIGEGEGEGVEQVVDCDLDASGTANSYDANGITTDVRFDKAGKMLELHQTWYCNDVNPLNATSFTADGSTPLDAECNLDQSSKQTCKVEGLQFSASKIATAHLPQSRLG